MTLTGTVDERKTAAEATRSRPSTEDLRTKNLLPGRAENSDENLSLGMRRRSCHL